MRLFRILIGPAILLMFAYLYGARIVDRAANRVRHSPDAAGAPTPSFPVADLHNDALLWDRWLADRHDAGQVDLPRLQQGGYRLVVFSATNSFPATANYRRTPPGLDLLTLLAVAHQWPSRTWDDPLERALQQGRFLFRSAAGSALVVVTDTPGLARLDSTTVGAILSIEGLHGLRGDVTEIDRLFDSAFRVFGLTHMADNEVAGSAHGWRKGGLTPFGRDVVKRIHARGGIVDLAHASPRTIADVLAMEPRPRVMVSHTGVDGTCPGNRNLSDDELRAMATADGIVGIGFWSGAVCGHDVASIARAVRYAVDIAGVDAIALGSEFDGGVVTPFDAAGVGALIPALAAQGFTASEIEAIMGGNALAFFRRALPADTPAKR
jgi:microsomal dipeptidase-like Zn-dependent dipeptidase